MSLKKLGDQEAVWLKGLHGRCPTLVNLLINRFHSSDNNDYLQCTDKKAHDLSLIVDVRYGEDVPLKRSLAERLGRVVDEELIPHQKGEYRDRGCIIRWKEQCWDYKMKQVIVFIHHLQSRMNDMSVFFCSFEAY